jgi:regulator of protease activity HflC (stomatin/prohibitin superfamily)
MFPEPGGIARSIAEAINSPFGFKVSSTWFFKLLQRSFIFLIAFAILTLIAASSLVIVRADEEAVVERFGRRLEATLQPGLNFKYPWPIEVAHKISAKRIHELKIGIKHEKKPAGPREQLILWTNKETHDPHLTVLVATPKLAEFLTPGQGIDTGKIDAEPTPGTAQPGESVFGEQTEAVPVSLLKVAVSIQYKIRDAYKWMTKYEDPQTMLDTIAKREINRYCASVLVADLMGGQRGAMEKDLRETIQRSVDRAGLDLDIVFLGLQGVHPPSETAEAFQDVVGAEQKRTATIRSAKADYNKRLADMAVNVRQAEELALAIEKMRRLESDEKASPAEKQAARDWVNALFFGDPSRGISAIGGQAANLIAMARMIRWQLENMYHSRAKAFAQELATKNAAPQVYYLRKYLEAMADNMTQVRKYLIAARGEVETRLFHLNLQDALTPSVGEMLEAEE